jgi:hypothetical protein
MKQFRFLSSPESDLIEIISQLKFKNLTNERMIALKNMIPTKEEMEELKRNEKKIETKIDSFCFEISKIRKLEEKMKILDSILFLENKSNDPSEKMKIQIDFYQQIVSSSKLKRIFELILSIGNSLNNVESKGFHFDFLKQLKDIKTNDGKTDLLDFIIFKSEFEEIDDFFEDFKQDYKNLIFIQQVEEEMNKYKAIEIFFHSLAKESLQHEKRQFELIEKYQSISSEMVEKISKKWIELNESFHCVLKYFGEDIQTTSFSEKEFFQILFNFFNEFKMSKKLGKYKKLKNI